MNDSPHVGHLYTTLAADILARYHKLVGDDVHFLTGTDEHGAKVAEIAEKKGLAPKEFADQISEQFKAVWAKYDITYDRFIRTTDADHEKAVVDFVTKLNEKGFIYKGEYKGLYCRGCESYKKQSDLVDGKCPDHQRVPEELSEPAYFFKLSGFKAELTKLIASNSLKIGPEIRKNEVLSFLEGQELEDVAISRQNVAWGIPLPWDESQTIYVWVDALINYYTEGKAKGLWPADLHLMAKDILRFHCVIWPAMLLAIGEEPPKSIFVHGYFTVDGQKMSKTLGNVIDPLKLTDEYPRDVIRYFLFKAFPFGNDGDFSHELLHEVYNGQLANELGNLVQRVLTMAKNFREGVVLETSLENNAGLVKNTWQKWSDGLDQIRFDESLKAIWELLKYANQRIDETKPWELAKTDQKKLDEVLYELLENIRHLSWLLLPFMPDTAKKIAELLNEPVRDHLSNAEFDTISQWGGISAGTKVKLGEVLFPRRG